MQLILTSYLCTFDGLKLLEKSKAAKWEADVFLQKNVSPKGSLWSWKKNICNALWWKNSDSLSYLRYLKYMKRASSAANVKCESLPPTEQAAMFHIYRVYLNSMNGTHSWKVLWTQKIGGRD